MGHVDASAPKGIVQHVAQVVQRGGGDVPRQQHQHVHPDARLVEELRPGGVVPNGPVHRLPCGHDDDIQVYQHSAQGSIRERLVSVKAAHEVVGGGAHGGDGAAEQLQRRAGDDFLALQLN